MSSAFKYNNVAEESQLLEFGVDQDQNRIEAGQFGPDGPEAEAIPEGRMNSTTRGGQVDSLPSPGNPSAGGLIENVPDILPAFLKNAAHPYVCLFHILFKSISILTYWIIYLLTKDVVLTFILTTIFLAFDFWTVKNVTGRILVGLRWWNKVNEDGSSEWMFESGVDRSQVSSLDRNVFWIALYVFPVYWIGAAISNILTFSPNFVVLNVMGVAFSGINALGYTKCSRADQQAVSNWATTQAMKVITGNVVQNLRASQQV
jgi:hypothetical protein